MLNLIPSWFAIGVAAIFSVNVNGTAPQQEEHPGAQRNFGIVTIARILARKDLSIRGFPEVVNLCGVEAITLGELNYESADYCDLENQAGRVEGVPGK